MEERLPRGWKAKIERGATVESLEWEELARKEWENMPMWAKAATFLTALLMPVVGSIV